MDTVSTFFGLGKSGEGLSFEFLCGKMNPFLDIIKRIHRIGEEVLSQRDQGTKE